MDLKRIIQQEGYRRQDLTDEHKRTLEWLDLIAEDFENFSFDDPDVFEGEPMSIIGQIKVEIANNVTEQVKEWLENKIADIQIAMAESEEDEND